ncbi:tetratricopeptide repeat protein [Weissella viridescens]|uniref:tetratricopeptide repeat protein n=1 Tax=Weissella viridescens TaxID=1629 RepID=UPI001D07A895|nr:tetratricopeptide repeat protein [Weissella viridescens]MCB6840269.1 tetratricopeptide repeat protein [Weissella viridescens]MCB6847001.1 tetratricopeptide repeat protein [Weissella viridescens]
MSEENQNEEPKKDAKYYFGLGNDQLDKGDYDGAIASYNKGIKLGDADSNYFGNRGNAQITKGDNDGAIVLYTIAIELNDSVPSYFNNKGVAQARNGDYDDAVDSYNKAIELDSMQPKYFNNRGIAYYKIEKGEKAAVTNWYQAFTLYEGSTGKDAEAERICKLVIEKEMSDEYDKSFEMMCYLASSTSFFPDVVGANEIDMHIEKLTSQELIDTSEKSGIYEYNKFLEKVLLNLQKFGNSKEDFKKVFNFLYSINVFKKNRYQAAVKDAKDATLYQYTSLDVLKIFLGFKEKEDDEKSENIKDVEQKQINLRLNNTNYMNDPTEGSYFVKKVLSGVKEPQDDERKEIENKFLKKNTSHAFIASLTYKKFDDIPMWKMYGRDSRGVAIGFSLPSHVLEPVSEDVTDMASAESEIKSNQDLVSDDTKNGKDKFKINSNEYLDEKALLYKIFYYDTEKEQSGNVKIEKGDSIEEKAFELINQITKAYEELMSVYANIQDVVQKKTETQEKTEDQKKAEIQKEIENQKKTLLNFIDWEFDRINFLVKDIQYQYEDEYRILRLTKDYSETKNDVGSPQLYVEVGDVEIKEVIFGAQSQTAMQWSPYIHKVLGDDVEVRDSDTSIKF